MLRIPYLQQRRGFFQVYKGPVRPSLVANKTYPILIWNNIIPYQAKYLTAFGASILSFIKIHPLVLITLGPPICIGSYFLYKWLYNKLVNKEAKKAVGGIPPNMNEISIKDQLIISPLLIVKILPYDETQLYNLQHDIDNEYQSFTTQVVDLIEQRIIEFVSRNKLGMELNLNLDLLDLNLDSLNEKNSILSDFIIDGSQLNVHIFPDQIETFTTTTADLSKAYNIPGTEGFPCRFVKLLVPYFSERDVAKRKRLGVISAWLINLGDKDDSQWSMVINVSRIGWREQNLLIREIDDCEYMESKMYQQYGKEK
ncbi:hypothetical protein LELG_05102 [Lodderomyces elongisporus NRRL YB-4239]|uniref:Uncharacterized protein n=1 Tax=Lodderomyces elongisporus (strain ATCC 11503 / CBS 2605 / JCM 1781 / NBRC 1676 / NRRL YB-4239) TaxID=379508 RepID=A5E663_LODEL|nr:hypothetical protein LELG_05102 [Lodderomyces elongisporus NRRL YB-4239]